MVRQPTIVALIPARAGSKRVRDKNIRSMAGHPLIAYTITSTLRSGVFDRVIVSTDSEQIRKIAVYYGAEAPFLRPAEFATSVSPDIDWIKHALSQLGRSYDIFALLRPTSPFRSGATITRALEKLARTPRADSVRAVELCKQHPGKMWVIDGELIKPLLDQTGLAIPWHSSQYQALPEVYVQNSSLEVAWTRVITEMGLLAGKVVAPLVTIPPEGFSIDYESDWYLAEHMVEKGEAVLPAIDIKPWDMSWGLRGNG